MKTREISYVVATLAGGLAFDAEEVTKGVNGSRDNLDGFSWDGFGVRGGRGGDDRGHPVSGDRKARIGGLNGRAGMGNEGVTGLFTQGQDSQVSIGVGVDPDDSDGEGLVTFDDLQFSGGSRTAILVGDTGSGGDDSVGSNQGGGTAGLPVGIDHVHQARGTGGFDFNSGGSVGAYGGDKGQGSDGGGGDAGGEGVHDLSSRIVRACLEVKVRFIAVERPKTPVFSHSVISIFLDVTSLPSLVAAWRLSQVEERLQYWLNWVVVDPIGIQTDQPVDLRARAAIAALTPEVQRHGLTIVIPAWRPAPRYAHAAVDWAFDRSHVYGRTTFMALAKGYWQGTVDIRDPEAVTACVRAAGIATRGLDTYLTARTTLADQAQRLVQTRAAHIGDVPVLKAGPTLLPGLLDVEAYETIIRTMG